MNWMIEKVDIITHILVRKRSISNVSQGEEIFDDTFRISHIRLPHIHGHDLQKSMSLYSCSLDDAPESVNHPSKNGPFHHSDSSRLTVISRGGQRRKCRH
jgi:hypothetical protein